MVLWVYMSDEIVRSTLEAVPPCPELDEKYPISSLNFGEEDIRAIAAGSVPGFMWVSLLRNSPAGNSEAERLMGRVISLAARAGHWQDMEDPFNHQTEQRELAQGGGSFLNWPRAFALLCDTGLAVRVEGRNGKAAIRPTEKMLEFFVSRQILAPQSS